MYTCWNRTNFGGVAEKAAMQRFARCGPLTRCKNDIRMVYSVHICCRSLSRRVEARRNVCHAIDSALIRGEVAASPLLQLLRRLFYSARKNVSAFGTA
jgi:hypothetical protein